MSEKKTTRKIDGRIRLTILGGYLGSGKTTWLRHQLFKNAFGRVHILVNEAAETPVDDILLAEHATGMTLLSGGCACCAGQEELIRTLRKLCDERSRSPSDEARLEQIILETSGLADPAAIASAIQNDPVLVHHVRLDKIIVLVDALNIADQLGTEYLGRQQIEAADHIILTKADLQDPSVLSSAHVTVELINPGATLSAAVKGEAFEPHVNPDAEPFDLPLQGDAKLLEPITPTRLAIGDEVDWAAFSVWLSALLHARGKDIVRVKGVFATPAGPLLLQGVRNSVQAPEMLPPSLTEYQNNIVFIGRGFQLDELEASLNYFSLNE
jgi:G3E family GTPase